MFCLPATIWLQFTDYLSLQFGVLVIDLLEQKLLCTYSSLWQVLYSTGRLPPGIGLTDRRG